LNGFFPRRAGGSRRPSIGAVAIVVTLIAPGCSRSGPEHAQVTGTVRYNGNPVTKGTITFQTSDPKGTNATGTIGPDGKYTLQTEESGDGALLGEYRVAIFARDDAVLDYIPTKPVPPKRLVPEKYESPDTSELKATVKSGRNEIPFDLK
jgi:hypothetical protein